jgi:hypothetical protein
VFAPAGFLDAPGAARALLCLLLDDFESRVFLFNPILDPRLVIRASFVLVPRAIARDAGSSAALVAFANVWFGRRRVGQEFLLSLLLLFFTLLLPLLFPLSQLFVSFQWRRSLCPIRAVLRPTTTTRNVMAVAWLGFHWTHIIAIAVVVAIVVVAISILDLATDMHMPSLASRSKTPAPPRSILSLINPLKLDIPTKSRKVSKTSQPSGGKQGQNKNNHQGRQTS